MRIDESYDNKSVTLPVGDTIELSLAENPTTGYRWTLASPGAPICELKGDEFVSPGQKPGESGTHNFTFAIREEGQATIALKSARKWADADAGRDFTVNVRATASRAN
jgi:inhibitor of cysteine peptidase